MTNKGKRAGRGALTVHTAAAAASLIACLAARLTRDSLIMDYGIRRARSIRNGLLILAGVLIFSLLLHIALRAKRDLSLRQRTAREQALRQEAGQRFREEDARRRARLSVDEKLNGGYLRGQLERHCQGAWGSGPNQRFREGLIGVCGQMDEMDLYQQKLDHLLTNNGMSMLDDARDTLEQVEQYLLKNSRKLVNCMDVYDPADPGEAGRLESLLSAVLEDNTKQLRNVKEFLLAMTDYINRQGEDDSDIERLNIYKTAIMNSMKEG